MKRLAVVASLMLVASAAALVVLGRHERVAELAQMHAERDQMGRQLAQIENVLATLRREGAVPAGASPGGASAQSASREVPAANAVAAPDTPERRAVREENRRAGNAIVDRAIDSGLWSMNDVAAVGAATPDLSGEERAQILARLAVAINTDRVRFDRERH